MKFFDNHNHSTFSPDSHSTVEAAVRRAMELGLAGIAITDHHDIDAPSRDQEFSFDDYEQCRNFFKEVINLLRQMNYSEFKSEKFENYKQQLTNLLNNGN